MRERKKRVLVTGGAGFIGSHLCERLIAAGCAVICVDNLFTGTRANVAGLAGHGRFEFVRHDVEQPFTMEIDEIYHLACPASPVHYQRNPARTLRTAVIGTANVLEVARESGARIVIASTSEVYGDPLRHPQDETYWGNVNPIGPRACYDEGKRCAEAFAVSFARQFDVDVRIARIFNTYGPRLHDADGRVISNFIVQALRSQPITIYGSGSQTRSFCFVSDLVEGLVRLMACDDPGGPVNLGNPGETTMLELARVVQRLTHSNTNLVYEALPPDDPVRRQPDITRARQLLGWQPNVALDAGLRVTIEYFQALLGGASEGSRSDARADLGTSSTHGQAVHGQPSPRGAAEEARAAWQS